MRGQFRVTRGGVAIVLNIGWFLIFYFVAKRN
jgi:hypothetical protein